MSRRVLFLPGASGAGAFWAPVAGLLPSAWVKECLDWPGLGQVPPDPRVRGFDDLASLVVERVAEGGGGPVDLVAQSMGGVVAVQVALRRPDLVRRLVLTATSGGIDLAPFGVADWRPEYRRAYPSAAAWITEARVDLGARLGEVEAPALLLWSDADPISPPAVGERLATLLPRARLVVVPGGDHLFAWARATEVAPHIAEHLTASRDFVSRTRLRSRPSCRS